MWKTGLPNWKWTMFLIFLTILLPHTFLTISGSFQTFMAMGPETAHVISFYLVQKGKHAILFILPEFKNGMLFQLT